jgi:hypothetical protein
LTPKQIKEAADSLGITEEQVKAGLMNGRIYTKDPVTGEWSMTATTRNVAGGAMGGGAGGSAGGGLTAEQQVQKDFVDKELGGINKAAYTSPKEAAQALNAFKNKDGTYRKEDGTIAKPMGATQETIKELDKEGYTKTVMKTLGSQDSVRASSAEDFKEMMTLGGETAKDALYSAYCE